jgi:hypothetical protein
MTHRPAAQHAARHRPPLRRWLALGAAGLLTGCASDRYLPDGEQAAIRSHVVIADAEGFAVDPATREPFDPPTSIEQPVFRHYLDTAFKRMDAYFNEPAYLAGNPSGGTTKRILIHVHGGLNSFSDAITTVENTYQRIATEANGEDRYFPFFVCWNSDGLSTYGQHLFSVSQGEEQPVLTTLASPVSALVDLATGLVESPITWYRQITDIDLPAAMRRGSLNRDDLADPGRNPAVLKANGIDVGLGVDRRSNWSLTLSGLIYWPTLPFKILTNPLISGVGSPAWNMMLRRTDSIFHVDEEFALSDQGLAFYRTQAMQIKARGSAAVFMECLRTHLVAMAGRHPETTYEIMLVGHSMGSIVINKLLLAYQDLPIRRIVYMAPACSIREAAASIVPYIRQQNAALPGHIDAAQQFSVLQRGQSDRLHYTQFYLLTLHPEAEKREAEGYDLVPRGSLLEWVDNFYSTPSSAIDRRLGTWENALSAINPFLGIGGDIHIKAFGFAGDAAPSEHGDFNHCPFWTRAFREIPASSAVISEDAAFYSHQLW